MSLLFLKKQSRYPRDAGPQNTTSLSTIGLRHPDGTFHRNGKDWVCHHVCRQETFSLVAIEAFNGTDLIGYTKQENYIKICFWLGGRHTTVLDGFGQYEHSRPEIYFTSGPREMIKIDLLNKHTHIATVALCLLRDFFPTHLRLSPEDLPEPLRSMALPDEKPFAFHAMPLCADLVAATRAVLVAPPAVRREEGYARAKAIELMYLLIHSLIRSQTKARPLDCVSVRHESRLREARSLLARHYSEPLTLQHVARGVGLNRMALTSGFRRLFGMSVHDCLQKERMERAYELLMAPELTVAQIAEAVGYSYSCNFSTAFRAHFGCTPQEARLRR